MKLIRRWNEYMGPKDERIESKLGQIYKVGYTIFVIGTIICLYYGLMLDQVSDVAGRPIYTQLGDALFRPTFLLIVVILIAGIVPSAMMMREGIVNQRTRMAQVEHVPWGYVALISALMGLAVCLGCFVLRALAEIQIVGLANVMWLGDAAIGVVFGGMIFIVGAIVFASSISSAIKRRKQLESELED